MKAWAGAMMVAATLVSLPAAAQQRVVNVFNWSDYIAPESLAQFTRETGIRVRYDTYDSNELLEARLTAGRSGYDIVVPTATPFLRRQLTAGLHQPLDMSKLPNRQHLDPAILRDLAQVDANNAHAIPWMWGTSGIGVNIDRVKRIMPDAPVYSLAMIFDPEIVARFRGCGVVMLDSPTDVFPAVLRYLGRNPDSHDLADLQAATEHLMKIRPSIRKFHSSEYINDLATGNACVAFGYSGDIFQAASRAEEARRPFTVQYAIPTEGALLWIDAAVIPKDARNVAEAHEFLNFLMRPEVAVAAANLVGYATANSTAVAQVKSEIRDNPSIFPPAVVRERLYTITVPPQDYERARTRAWTRIKTGR
ncbi:MAG: polyamine ABC transporter substrate-binding protein [Alphaproteobacteria bacterium]|nr:polyamine ABC transporter substrate-binding protein [Alphaproteobacteria bacterium]